MFVTVWWYAIVSVYRKTYILHLPYLLLYKEMITMTKETHKQMVRRWEATYPTYVYNILMDEDLKQLLAEGE